MPKPKRPKSRRAKKPKKPSKRRAAPKRKRTARTSRPAKRSAATPLDDLTQTMKLPVQEVLIEIEESIALSRLSED